MRKLTQLEQAEKNTNPGAINDIVFKSTKIGQFDFSKYFKLQRVEVSECEVDSIDTITKMKDLRNVNFSHNSISQIPAFSPIQSLVVLNLGFNQISAISGLEKLSNLKALILNNNQISVISGIEKLLSLNTLILSNNKIKKIENLNMQSLDKVNLSHNQIKVLEGFEKLPNLKEVKLNENKISDIPSGVFENNRVLRVLDLGKNQIKDKSKIAGLNGLKCLKNLSLLGNGVLEEFDADDAQHIIPVLEIYNYTRLVEKVSFVEKRGQLNQEEQVKKKLQQRKEKRALLGLPEPEVQEKAPSKKFKSNDGKGIEKKAQNSDKVEKSSKKEEVSKPLFKHEEAAAIAKKQKEVKPAKEEKEEDDFDELAALQSEISKAQKIAKLKVHPNKGKKNQDAGNEEEKEYKKKGGVQKIEINPLAIKKQAHKQLYSHVQKKEDKKKEKLKQALGNETSNGVSASSWD